jgi:hypothetical protein
LNNKPSSKRAEVCGIFFDPEDVGDMFLRNIGLSELRSTTQSNSHKDLMFNKSEDRFSKATFPLSRGSKWASHGDFGAAVWAGLGNHGGHKLSKSSVTDI